MFLFQIGHYHVHLVSFQLKRVSNCREIIGEKMVRKLVRIWYVVVGPRRALGRACARARRAAGVRARAAAACLRARLAA